MFLVVDKKDVELVEGNMVTYIVQPSGIPYDCNGCFFYDSPNDVCDKVCKYKAEGESDIINLINPVIAKLVRLVNIKLRLGLMGANFLEVPPFGFLVACSNVQELIENVTKILDANKPETMLATWAAEVTVSDTMDISKSGNLITIELKSKLPN